MDIFFPMAGQGARFGHTFKPFLTIGQETFIEAAVASFRPFASRISRFVFVYLEAQEASFNASTRLAEMFVGLPIQSVHLATPTRGPAETVGRAVEQLGASGPAMICDCDHALDVAPLFARFASGAAFDAVLPVWPLDVDDIKSWSVAMVEDGRTWAISEKSLPAPGTRGAPMGVIGCYGFRDLARITERGNALRATNYSDILRQMLDQSEVVEAVEITRARFFGDPERLAKELEKS